MAVDVVEGLVSLVGKNLLVRQDRGGEPRYHMLQTIRDFAGERLIETGEADDVRRRFTASFLDLAERAEKDFQRPEGDSWFDRLEQEHENFISALAVLCEGGDRIPGVRLVGMLGEFWVKHFPVVEGHHWLETFHNLSRKDDPPAPRARLAFYLGRMRLWFDKPYGDGSAGLECFEESIRIGRETGDLEIVALSLSWMGWHCFCVPQEIRWAALEESVRLAREAGLPWLLARCIRMAYSGEASVDKSSEFKIAALEEAISIARRIGDSVLLCYAMHGMGDVFLYLGEHEAARGWFLKANRMAREIDDRFQVFESLYHLITIHLARGELSHAKAACIEALRLVVKLNYRMYFPRLFSDMAEIAMKEGHFRRTAWLRAAAAQYRKPDAVFEPGAFRDLGLTEDAARAEWAAAKSMSEDQAVAYALSRGE